MYINENYLSVEINDHGITAIEFSYGWRKIYLQSFSHVDLPEGIIVDGQIKNENALEKAFLELLELARPKKFVAKMALLSVCEDLMYHHTFVFASGLKTEEVDAAVWGSLENFFPFKKDEIYGDYIVQDGVAEGKNQVYFTAASRVDIDKYLNLLNKQGFNVQLLSSVAEVYKGLALEDINDDADYRIFLDIDYNKTYCFVFCHGSLVKMKAIDCGLKNYVQVLAQNNSLDEKAVIEILQTGGEKVKRLSVDDDYLEDRINEIILLVKEVARGLKVAKIFAWGNGLRVPSLFWKLKEQIETPLELKILWNKLTLSKEFIEDNKLINSVNTNIIEFGIVGGAASNFVNNLSGPETLNILPLENKEQIGHRMLYSFISRASILSIMISVVLIFISGVCFFNTYFEYKLISQKTQNFDSLIYGQRYKIIKSKVDDFNNEVAIINSLEEKVKPVPAIFFEILDYRADNIRLNSMVYLETEKKILIRGMADTRNNLLEYQNFIKNLTQDAQVDSPLSNFDSSSNIDFQLAVIFPNSLSKKK